MAGKVTVQGELGDRLSGKGLGACSVFLKADLHGDWYLIQAPDGCTVEAQTDWPWRILCRIPGLLCRLGVWEVIEAARQELYGLRVVKYEPYSTRNCIRCEWREPELPLFSEALGVTERKADEYSHNDVDP